MFVNRKEAGKRLAKEILNQARYVDKAIIIGITRGGVVVAREAADFLHVPLRVIVIKKIGAPYNSELAIGAIGPEDTLLLDKELVYKLNISKEEMTELSRRAKKEQKMREQALGLDSFESLEGKSAILVDDGVATGITVMTALDFLKRKGCKNVILATPVIGNDVLDLLKNKFDKIVSVTTSSNFHAVGQFYREFEQVSDEEVLNLI